MNDNSVVNEIVPGILETDWEEIEKKLTLLKPFASTIHVDLIDNKFVHNKTFFDPQPYIKYADYFFLELHLMVDDPLKYVKSWSEAGFKRFIAHIEQMPDPVKFIADTQLLGEVGLAIDTPTSLDKIKQLNIDLLDLDAVLIMTVKAGFSGQKFIPEMLMKVKDLRAMSDTLTIEVDGGLNDYTVKTALEAGANRFVTTSSLFKTKDVRSRFLELQKIVVQQN